MRFKLTETKKYIPPHSWTENSANRIHVAILFIFLERL